MRSRTGRLPNLVLSVFGLAAIVGAFLIGHVSAPRSSPAAARSHAAPADASTSDAEEFAVQAVRQLNSPRMVDPSYRSATLARFLDPSARALADRFVPGPAFEQATGLSADQNAGRTAVAEVVPLALSAWTTHGDVRVSVWAVSVIGTRRFGELAASWSTESLALRRGSAGWRVVGYHSTPGPVPAATQPPTDVRTALNAVTEMRSVADAG